MGGYQKKRTQMTQGLENNGESWTPSTLQWTEILQQDMGHRLWGYNAEKEAIKQEGHPDTQDLCAT